MDVFDERHRKSKGPTVNNQGDRHLTQNAIEEKRKQMQKKKDKDVATH